MSLDTLLPSVSFSDTFSNLPPPRMSRIIWMTPNDSYAAKDSRPKDQHAQWQTANMGIYGYMKVIFTHAVKVFSSNVNCIFNWQKSTFLVWHSP